MFPNPQIDRLTRLKSCLGRWALVRGLLLFAALPMTSGCNAVVGAIMAADDVYGAPGEPTRTLHCVDLKTHRFYMTYLATRCAEHGIEISESDWKARKVPTEPTKVTQP